MVENNRTNSADPVVDRALATLREHREDQRANPAWEARVMDRAVARVVDFAIVATFGCLWVFPIGYIRRSGDDDGAAQFVDADRTLVTFGPSTPSMEWLVVFVVAMALFLAYELVATAMFGSTFGKLLLRLRIVDRVDREPVSAGRLLLRSAIWVVPVTAVVLTWFVSMLYAWTALVLVAVIFGRAFRIDTLRETLCDRVAGTAVMDLRLAKQAALSAAETAVWRA